VDADDRGFGMLDAMFGDRETRYRRIGNEVQSVGRGGGTHVADANRLRVANLRNNALGPLGWES